MANLLTDDWRKRASEIYAENAGEDAYLNSVMAEYGIAPKTAAAVDNGILSGFAQGYKSGFGGVGAGLAHAAEAELGVGGGLAKSLDTMAQENAPGKEYDWEEMIPFASDYYTNGQGAARGLGSLVGSMTVPAAVGAGIMTALPTAAAGTLGSGAVAMGLGALPMAVSEGGNTYAKGKELGMSEEKARAAGRQDALTKLPFYMVSEALTGKLGSSLVKGLGKEAGQSLVKKAATTGGKIIAGAVNEGYEEGTENRSSEYALGQRPDISSAADIFNPTGWNKDDWDNAKGVVVPTILAGGIGASAGHVYRNGKDLSVPEKRSVEMKNGTKVFKINGKEVSEAEYLGKTEESQPVFDMDNLRAAPIADGIEDTGLQHTNNDLANAVNVLNTWAYNQFGKDLIVSGGWRSEQHNAAVNGSPTSHHLYGNALDVDASNFTEEERKQIDAKAREMGFNSDGENMYHDRGSGLHFHFILPGKANFDGVNIAPVGTETEETAPTVDYLNQYADSDDTAELPTKANNKFFDTENGKTVKYAPADQRPALSDAMQQDAMATAAISDNDTAAARARLEAQDYEGLRLEDIPGSSYLTGSGIKFRPVSRPQGKQVSIKAPATSAPTNKDFTAEHEREAVQVKAANAVAAAPKGKSVNLKVDSGKEFSAQYAVVPADSLITSNNAHDFSVNTAYPKELQPRDRSRAYMRQQVESIANDVKPKLLAASDNVNEGAPVISRSGVVENGNGRSMALARMWADPGKAEAQRSYRTHLLNSAEDLGLDRQAIASIKNPVLVRVRNGGNVSVDDIVTSTKGGMQLGTAEQAVKDSKRLKASTFRLYSPNRLGQIDNSSNTAFVSAVFSDIVSKDEVNAYTTKDGELSKAGKERAVNAILVKAYGDSSVLTDIVENTNDKYGKLADALVAAAPSMAKLRAQQALGDRYKVDLAADVVGAVEFIGTTKADSNGGKTVRTAAAEQAMFGGASDIVKKLAVFMDDNKGNRWKNISDMLLEAVNVVDSYGDPKQGNMFGEAVAAPESAEVFDCAIKKVAPDFSVAVLEDKGEVDNGKNSETEENNDQHTESEQAEQKESADREEAESTEAEIAAPQEETLETVPGSTSYSFAEEGEELNPFAMEEWEAQAKDTFPNMKNFTRNGSVMEFDLPNGEHMKVDIVDRIVLDDEQFSKAQADYGGKLKGNDTVLGSVRSIGAEAFMTLSRSNVYGTVDHEALHYARKHGLTERENKALDKAFHGDEEAMAEAFRKWRIKWKARGQGSDFGVLWRKISDFAMKVAEILGFENKHNVFRKIESGKVWERSKGAAKAEAKHSVNNGKQGMSAAAERQLRTDEQQFARAIDNFVPAKLSSNGMVRVMTTPRVMELAGARVLPIEIRNKTIKKIIDGKHNYQMDKEILKQLPRALADPVAIYYSDTIPGPDNIVVALNVKDKNGANVIVSFALNEQSNKVDPSAGYELNVISSAYGKDNGPKNPTPRNEWFVEQIEKGNLKYINKKKLKDLFGTDERLLARSSEKINELHSSLIIKDENDLVKLWKNNPERYSALKQTDTAAFKKWFGKSKVVDENGEPLVVYHGTQRADRVGNIFRPDRATSGPMAFFTDSEEVAQNYAKNKADTSFTAEFEDQSYEALFRVKRANGTSVRLVDYWRYLPAAKKQEITKKGAMLTLDDDDNLMLEAGNKNGVGDFEYALRDYRGNALAALTEGWLNGGTLYNEEARFLDVLREVGMPMDNVFYNDPDFVDSKVYPVYMKMEKPFDTSKDITEAFIADIKKAAEKAPVATNRRVDDWDKTSIAPFDWVAKLEEDIEDGTTRAWTVIPDFVTDYLKSKGYDGIKDTGGKYGGDGHNVYVPFDSTQVKSATDNTGSFDASNPDIRYSIFSKSEKQGEPDTPEARGNAAVTSEKEQTMIERLKAAKDNFYKDWVDKLDPLNKLQAGIEKALGRKLDYKDNVYKRARMAESTARGRAEMLVTGKDPAVAIKAINKTLKVKLKHNVTLRSVFDIINEKDMSAKHPDYLKRGNFKNWQKAFSVYLTARRQLEIQAKSPDYTGSMSKADAEAIVRSAPAELAKAAEAFYKFNDNMLTIAEEGGLISAERHQLLNDMYSDYAPMLRDFSDTAGMDNFFGGVGRGGIGNVSSFLKKLSKEGSSRNVIDPLETTVKNTYMVLDRAERNKVAQNFVRLSDENGIGTFIEKAEGAASDPKNSVFTVMIDGKKQAFKTMPEFYGAIAGYNEAGSIALCSLFRTTAQALRTGATISPDFMVRNLIRDTIFAGISSKTGFVPFLDTVRGMIALRNNEELAAEFRAAGVPMSNFIGTNRRGAAQTLDKMAGGSDWRTLNPKKMLHALYEMLQDYTELAENGTRMGEFMRARKQGKSIEEAGFLAKEVTLDFGRSGVYGQQYNQAVPFFNACIQGGDKMYRLCRQAPIPTAMALLRYIVAPSLVLWAYNYDKEWYKDLPDDVKNGSWCIKTGDTIWRIPKPQEAGVLFGSSFERFLDSAAEQNPKAAKEWARYLVADVATPNIIPTLFLPLLEWVTNYSFFTGKAIVGMRYDRLPNEQQFTPYTSELAKRVGSVTGTSPMKIDNTIKGYFGSAGSFVAQSMDNFFGKPYETPAKRWSELAAIRGLTFNEGRRSQAVSDFYEMVDEAEKQHAGYGEKGKPATYLKGLRAAADRIRDMNKDIRTITVNPRLSAEAKRQRIDKLNERIRFTAKKANAVFSKFVYK